MKIIEALKEIPLIDKKISNNLEQIRQYASDVQNGHTELPYKTVEGQQKEVDSLIQSNKDLVKRKIHIKESLSITNTKTKVTIEGETNSIAGWIALREGGMNDLIRTQSALVDDTADGKLTTTAIDPEHGIKVVRFYEEKKKNEEIARLQEIAGKIDGTLEVINATTDLIEQ